MEATTHVTDAPILERPEWTDVPFGSSYRLTVRVVGDDIVLTQPAGTASTPVLEPALQMVSRIVSETIGDRRPYVHIADYSLLKSASAEARRTFIDYLLGRRNLVGVVFYGVSPILRMSIKLGSRLHFRRAKVAIADGFEEAMDRAREILDRRSRRPGVDSAGDVRGRAPDAPGSPREWLYEKSSFRLRWEIIDGNVMHGAASGVLRSEHIGDVVAFSDEVVQRVRRFGRRPAMIIDIKELEGVSVAGRRRFVDTLAAWQRDNELSLLALYGANPMLKGAIAISRPFLPFPLTQARDLRAAMRLVPSDTRKRGGERRTRADAGRRTQTATDQHIDDVLRFLGNINWERDGMEWWRDDVPTDHPLTPVFDAITLLKADVDHLLTERKHAEEALRESTERYGTILENIADGYYEVDLEGRLSFCNDAMLDILGQRRDAVPELDPEVFMAPAHAAKIRAAFKRVYRTRRPAKVLDWELIRSDGRKVSVEASISLIEDSEGRPSGFRGIVRDVSERAMADRDRARLEAQLRQAQRMEAVGTLAGGIAHNFNNLLMGIQGNVSLILKDTSPRHPHHQRLQTVETLVKGGSKLTAELLGFARAGRYEVRAIDINELVCETAETFATTRREIRVHLDLASRLLRVRADRGQVEQVLLNLFINASDAMPDGGDLHLRTRLVSHSELQGRQYEPKPGDYVQILVRDTGLGMDEATQRRIFEPFFTTKGLSGGTGLGLASVYGTVKAHGGYVDVASEPGDGATFTLSLPATDEEVFSAEDTQGEIMLGRGTVLVVDDDEAVLEACASILSYLEYTPLRADTGTRAVELFEEHSGAVDLVILDMILPDISGGDVFDAIRSIDPHIKVLLASGYSLNGAAQDILERGCDDFIQKPFTIEQLSQKINTVLSEAP
jgi:PAS domain S-box-containing protein